MPLGARLTLGTFQRLAALADFGRMVLARRHFLPWLGGGFLASFVLSMSCSSRMPLVTNCSHSRNSSVISAI
jgi:hypothetical protein